MLYFAFRYRLLERKLLLYVAIFSIVITVWGEIQENSHESMNKTKD